MKKLNYIAPKEERFIETLRENDINPEELAAYLVSDMAERLRKVPEDKNAQNMKKAFEDYIYNEYLAWKNGEK